MIYTLTLTELVVSVFSALMLLASLYAIGRLIHARLKWQGLGADAALVNGMAANHLAFLLLSLCFEGETVIMLLHAVHILSVAFALTRHPRWFLPNRNLRFQPAIIMLVLYLPYLFSPVSPPMNYDAMFAYVHNAEWVYHHGLKFNPASTAYTTMPMGAEYLFAQVFPIGGKHSIFLLDACFGLLLVRKVFCMARRYLSARAALIFVLTLMLIPEGVPFLFGIAKVDMINIYLIISGVGWLTDPSNRFRYWLALLAFSMACAVKYTGWLQLSLPIIALVVMIFRSKGITKSFFAVLIPMMFIGPVLIKNFIQTGNPMVGLAWSPSQRVYVEPHAGVTRSDLDRKISGSIEQGKDPVRTTIQFFYLYLNFVLYGILLLLWLFAQARGVNISDLDAYFLFLIFALIPWHVFVGTTLQPPRFMLGIYIIILLLCFILLQRVIARQVALRSTVIRYAFMAVFTLTFFNTYYRHGSRIPKFLQSQRIPLHQWYEQSGNFVFAITARLRDEGWLCQRIMFMSPIAKGLLSTDQLTKDHADSSRWAFRNQFSLMYPRYDYVLCSELDVLKYGLQDRPVVLQSGHMYLIKLH